MSKRFGVIISILAIMIFLMACDKASTDKTQANISQNKVADAKQGGNLFRKSCARCHGLVGNGTSNGPPLVHPIYRPNHHSDKSFYRAVEKGLQQHHWEFGDMPAISGVAREDVSHIIAFIRGLQRKAGIK